MTLEEDSPRNTRAVRPGPDTNMSRAGDGGWPRQKSAQPWQRAGFHTDRWNPRRASQRCVDSLALHGLGTSRGREGRTQVAACGDHQRHVSKSSGWNPAARPSCPHQQQASTQPQHKQQRWSQLLPGASGPGHATEAASSQARLASR